MTELVVLDVWPQGSSPVVLPGSVFVDLHLGGGGGGGGGGEESYSKTKPASCTELVINFLVHDFTRRNT